MKRIIDVMIFAIVLLIFYGVAKIEMAVSEIRTDINTIAVKQDQTIMILSLDYPEFKNSERTGHIFKFLEDKADFRKNAKYRTDRQTGGKK